MNLEQALENIKRFGKKLAEEEIVLIREHKEEAIPVLLEYVQNAINNSDKLPENFEDFDDPLYAMFLLAEFRVTAAFEPFIKFMELDNETAEWILGDALYEDLGAMIASVATANDIGRIKQIVENTAIDGYQRVTVLNVLVALYVEGIYARDDFFAYLGYLLDSAAEDTDDEAVFITFVAVACLNVYANEHFERIRQLYQDDMLDSSIVGMESFDEAVASDETEETALASLKLKSHTSFVRDTVKRLADWACFNEEKYSPAPTPMVSAGKQIINTAKTGRNDPCPCGSGKKYKKCCLYSPAKT